MTGPELSTALQTLGLDTQAAAKWLGVWELVLRND